MFKIFSFSVFLVCVLEVYIQSVNCIPPPAMNSRCNCIRAKDCTAYKTQLLNSRMDQLSSVIEQIRNAGCGFTEHSEPMLCCPTQIDISDANNHNSRSMHDRWVWERRAKTNDENSDRVSMEDKSVNAENRFISTNLIDDYVDWKTHRNCPPILYKETKNGFHKNFRGHHDHSIHDYDNLHNFHGFHPHSANHFGFDEHVGPHGFHHHPSHRNHFDGDYDGSEDTVHSGSKHEFFPTHFPMPEEPRSHGRPVTTTMRTQTFTTTTTTQKSLTTPPTVNSPSCGVTLNKRIIGGIEALPGEFPWITRIAYLNQTDNSIAYRCSGSFISELHILTAAHCVANLDASLSLTHVRLVDSNTSNDCNNQSKECQEPSDVFEIAETFVHPNYDNPKRAHDIAIIKIIKPPNVEANYGTICLPSKNVRNNNLIGGTGIVAGWSNDQGTDTSDLRVRYLRLGIMNNSDCAESYNTFREGFAEKITIISSMVCTLGQANGSNVCRGDSGGPLMDDGNSGVFNHEGRYTLLGIVAFGPICGLTNLLPSVYMRVSEYVDWIVSNIR